jgi:hypothetical protein
MTKRGWEGMKGGRLGWGEGGGRGKGKRQGMEGGILIWRCSKWCPGMDLESSPSVSFLAAFSNVHFVKPS